LIFAPVELIMAWLIPSGGEYMAKALKARKARKATKPAKSSVSKSAKKSLNRAPKAKAAASGGARTSWIVAVDPFTESTVGALKSMLPTIGELAGSHLKAVYVLAPSALNWTGDFSGPWFKKYVPLAEEKIRQLVANLNIGTQVVACKESGKHAAVMALLKVAQKMKAQGIAIAAHSRSGIERLALGSFAETLILNSKLPVLIYNPTHGLPSTHFGRILVTTDLSKKSEKYVREMAEYAKGLGAELVLFFKQPDPMDPIIQQGVYALGGGWMSLQTFIDEELKNKSNQLEKLESMIRAMGVRVSHVLDSSPEGLIESITRAAQEHKVDLVSVLTASGKWSSALLGSVARTLVRHAPCPVLVKR